MAAVLCGNDCHRARSGKITAEVRSVKEQILVAILLIPLLVLNCRAKPSSR